MRARKLMLTAVAIATVVGLAAPAGADHEFIYTPTTTKFFMRNSATACPGTPFLSTTAGQNEPGCGYQGGAPFGELYHNGAPVGSTIKTYVTEDGIPQYLDPSRILTGNVRVVATATTNRMAAGQVRVDVTLRARTSAGETLTLATSSETKLVDPTNSAETDFGFTMPLTALAAYDKVALTEITALVDIRGWHILTGYHRLNGQSWFDLPGYIRTVKPHVP